MSKLWAEIHNVAVAVFALGALVLAVHLTLISPQDCTPVPSKAGTVIAAHHKFAHALVQNLLPELEILGSKSCAIHNLLLLGECLLEVAGQGTYAVY